MGIENTAEYRDTIRADEIRITPIAGEQLAKLYSDAKEDGIEAIRVYVAGTGCSGMTYSMTFAEGKTEYDKVLEGDGYRFYVDVVALGYLRGVEIDYVTRNATDTFVFNNVFQETGGSGTCGACGAAVGPEGGCA